MIALLEQSARETGHVAVSGWIRGAAGKQDHPGSLGIGHVHSREGTVQVALQHREQGLPRAQVRDVEEPDSGMTPADGGERLRDLGLHVARRVEDEGYHDDPGGITRRAVQPFRKQYLGELHEAELDPVVRVALLPTGSELLDLPVGAGGAGAMSHQQDGLAHFSGCPPASTARRKRWAKAGS
jgi:hypothetical protein